MNCCTSRKDMLKYLLEVILMDIRCIWEHNGSDTILYCDDYPGAFTRGQTLEVAKGKMAQELRSYLVWSRSTALEPGEIIIVQEKNSDLQIRDADSDVLFDSEDKPLTRAEYEQLKALVLRSAADFHSLYESVPDKNTSCLPSRKTFYGPVPRTAEEMYRHTKSVNEYYFAEIGVDADNEGTILECRNRGFQLLEQQPGFLESRAVEGSYGEWWSVRKVLRRFLWHDRIHAKAMFRMARKTFGEDSVPNIFGFDL